MEQMSLPFNKLREMTDRDGCTTCKYKSICQFGSVMSCDCLDLKHDYSIKRGTHYHYYNLWEPR